jgi:hypothetical protein
MNDPPEIARAAEPILVMRGIGKRFAGVVALEDVDLDVRRDRTRPGRPTIAGEHGRARAELKDSSGSVLPIVVQCYEGAAAGSLCTSWRGDGTTVPRNGGSRRTLG